MRTTIATEVPGKSGSRRGCWPQFYYQQFDARQAAPGRCGVLCSLKRRSTKPVPCYDILFIGLILAALLIGFIHRCTASYQAAALEPQCIWKIPDGQQR